MNLLIFSYESAGHYLEYIHHLYIYAYRCMPDDEVTFVLPPAFRERMQHLDFPERESVRLRFMSPEEMAAYAKGSNFLLRACRMTALLKRYVKLLKPDAVFLPSLVAFIPWIVFAGKRLHASGIEYRIPGRRTGKVGLSVRMSDNLKLLVYAYAPSIRKVLLLNDKIYAETYNRRFRTSRFTFLPDPIVPVPLDKAVSCPIPLDKLEGKKVFLHCGGMGERKGTFTALEAIELLPQETRCKAAFIFAGRIDNKDEVIFRNTVKELSAGTEFYFIEGFLPFEQLAGLFRCSDYVLVPYKNVLQSSGVIGHAAQFGKPVIGPAEGLLGSLITEYGLGYTLPQLSAKSLSRLISELVQEETHTINGSSYSDICTPDNFSKAVFDSMKK
jgi:glycosyltransferase involved in cell wall biosynthesis